MASRKIGPNQPCPCGSGKKYKKCCGQSKQRATRYSREERASVLAKLERFACNDEFEPENEDAFEEYWGEWLDRPEELDEQLNLMSEHVFDLWFAFDRPLEDGRLVAELFLERQGTKLSQGERDFIHALRGTSMRLYEIEDLRPGETLTLHDLIEGDRVTVQERSGSRTAQRFEWIAARVVTPGASGRPEIDGLLQIPDFYHRGLREQIRAKREEFVKGHPGAPIADFYKLLPPSFHQVWVGSILEPYVPELANTDGEPFVLTRVLFDVLDAAALAKALDSAKGLERNEEKWTWSGDNAQGKSLILGTLEVRGDTLSLEVNSVARGERGRALLESAAGSAIRYRATSHENMQRTVREALQASGGEASRDAEPEIPFEIQEALVLDQMARHYRGWLDEPVPALDGQTPRAAAKDARLRPRVLDLLHDLDRMYQRSLKMGSPAFEPSWLHQELGLSETAPERPPLLAHERLAQKASLGEACRSTAEAIRRGPGFEDAVSVVTGEELRTRLDIQRALRDVPPGTLPAEPQLSGYLECVVNFELHRRKSFWVDAALVYMLANTELDVLGREVRVPFPSFALIFTDRYFLSLGERLLAREPENPLAGQFLRAATVFVTERRQGNGRALELTFAFDACGADLPQLLTHVIPMGEDAQLQAHLDTVAPTPTVEPAVPNANPLRGLLHVTLNTILYATSAGVEPQVRDGEPQGRARSPSPLTQTSETVYFLPGAIEISQVRRLQELERVHEGRTILRRFMVRGHWRRPAANWKEQRMRWIQPHWKGPDMATVIERAYKLKP